MSLIRKHVAVLQAWACLALVTFMRDHDQLRSNGPGLINSRTPLGACRDCNY